MNSIIGLFVSGALAFTAGTGPIETPIVQPTDSAFITAASDPTAAPLPFVFYEPPKWTYRSCVEFAKWLTGHQGVSYGAAGRIKPNIDDPEVGAWALTYEGPGHAVPIVEIDWQNRVFRTDEANWSPGKRTTRWLSFDDPKIRGYFKP